MSYTDWPLTMPCWIPASRISIASVKMNALKRSFTIIRPLKSPTAAPMPRTTRIPTAGGHSVPRPWPSVPTISHAPTIGASP
jgi:hypothetical protein